MPSLNTSFVNMSASLASSLTYSSRSTRMQWALSMSYSLRNCSLQCIGLAKVASSRLTRMLMRRLTAYSRPSTPRTINALRTLRWYKYFHSRPCRATPTMKSPSLSSPKRPFRCRYSKSSFSMLKAQMSSPYLTSSATITKLASTPRKMA